MPVDSAKWFDVQQVVAFVLVSVFCAVTVVWVFYHPAMDGPTKEIMMLLLGGLISMATTAVNFFFRRDT